MRKIYKIYIVLLLLQIPFQSFRAEEEWEITNKEDCYWEDRLCGFDAYFDYLYDVDYNCDRSVNFFVLCERVYHRQYSSNLLHCNATYINCLKRSRNGK